MKSSEQLRRVRTVHRKNPTRDFIVRLRRPRPSSPLSFRVPWQTRRVESRRTMTVEKQRLRLHGGRISRNGDPYAKRFAPRLHRQVRQRYERTTRRSRGRVSIIMRATSRHSQAAVTPDYALCVLSPRRNDLSIGFIARYYDHLYRFDLARIF